MRSFLCSALLFSVLSHAIPYEELFERDAPTCRKTTTTVFATVTEYPGAKSTPTGAQPGSSPLFSRPAPPTVTLVPTNHWSQDPTDLENLTPDEKCKIYASTNGRNDPNLNHDFAWSNVTFSEPACVLDQSSWITYSYSEGQMTCAFGSSEAYAKAQSSWLTSQLLVAHNAPGCGGEGGSCYFRVSQLAYDDASLTITCSGESVEPKDCISNVDANWGRYIGSSNGTSMWSRDKSNFTGSMPDKPLVYKEAYGIIASVMSEYLPGWDVRPTGSDGLPYTKPASHGSYTKIGGHTYYVPEGQGEDGKLTIVKPTSVSEPEVGHPSGSPSRSSWHTPSSGSAGITSGSVGGSAASSLSGGPFITHSSGASQTASSDTTFTISLTSRSSVPLSQVSSSLHSLFSSLSAHRFANSSIPASTSTSLGSTSSRSSSFSSFPTSTSSSLGSSSSSSHSLSSSSSSHSLSSSSSWSSSSSSFSSLSSRNSSSSRSTATSFSSRSSRTSSTSPTSSGLTWPISHCRRGVDPVYGLPTTCFGPAFDLDLNSVDGFWSLSDSDFAGIQLLFPGLIPNSVIKLRKRCFWGLCDIFDAIGDFFEDVVDFVSEVAADVADVIVNIVVAGVNAVINIAQSITEAAVAVVEGIIGFAEQIGQDLSEAAAQIIYAVQAAIEGAITLFLELPFGFEISAPDADRVESPWGRQVLLKSLSTPNPDQSDVDDPDLFMNIFCVDCGVVGDFNLAGTLSFGLFGISQLSVLFTADASLGAKLGINAGYATSYTMHQSLFQQGIPGFCSSNLFCVGPYVALAAELELNLAVEGKLLAGGVFELNEANANLCAIGCDSSASNWMPTFTPVVDADGEISASAAFQLPLSVGVGINILAGTFERDVSLTATPALVAEAVAAVSAGIDPATGEIIVGGGTPECAGIDFSLSYQQDLSYNVLGLLSGTLYDSGPIELLGYCLTIFGGTDVDEANLFTPTGLGGGSGDAPLVYGLGQMTTREKAGLVRSCDDTSIYWAPSSWQNINCTDQWTIPSIVQNANTSVLADRNRRLPVYFPEELRRTGVSRLQLVPANAIPKNSSYIAFKYQNTNNFPINMNGTAFSTVACNVPGETRQKLFIGKMNAGAAAAQTLMNTGGNTDLRKSIVGIEAPQCNLLTLQVLGFTILPDPTSDGGLVNNPPIIDDNPPTFEEEP